MLFQKLLFNHGWQQLGMLLMGMLALFHVSSAELDQSDGGMGGAEFEGGEGEGEGAGEEGDRGGGEQGDEDLGEGDEEDPDEIGTSRSARGELQNQNQNQLPKDIKDLVSRETAAGNTKTAQTIQRMYFSNRAWSQAFPEGIRQAREFASAAQEFGGLDGIRTIAEERDNLTNELDAIDSAYESADPQFVANLVEKNPEAFAQFAPLVVENWGKAEKGSAARATYNHVMARIFVNTLNGAGVVDYLGQMRALAETNKAQPGMAGILQGIDEILSQVREWNQLAQNAPERRADGAAKKLQDDRIKFEEERRTAFLSDVRTDVKTYLEDKLETSLGALLKSRGVDAAKLRRQSPERWNAMVREADTRFAQATKTDRAFNQQAQRFMEAGNRPALMNLHRRHIDRLLTDPKGPRIAQKVFRLFYSGTSKSTTETRRHGGTERNAGGTRTQAPAGSVRITRPNDDELARKIDWQRTTNDMIFDGKGYFKGDKRLHVWK